MLADARRHVFKRLETDTEYRKRLLVSGRFASHQLWYVGGAIGSALDEYGEAVKPPMQRRIVEVFEW